jgi:hypothetical protein
MSQFKVGESVRVQGSDLRYIVLSVHDGMAIADLLMAGGRVEKAVRLETMVRDELLPKKKTARVRAFKRAAAPARRFWEYTSRIRG